MRRTVRCGAILALFLALAAHLDAEPILRGYRVEPRSHAGAATKLPKGKSLVLAQIFNSDAETMTAGEFEIGMEITAQGKTRSFIVKPRISVVPGAMRTFPLMVPENDLPDNATIKVFARHAGKTFQAELGQAPHDSSALPITKTAAAAAHGPVGVKTLYTEAPPEADAIKPPPEVPFEKVGIIGRTAAKLAAASSANQQSQAKPVTAAAPVPAKPVSTTGTAKQMPAPAPVPGKPVIAAAPVKPVPAVAPATPVAPIAAPKPAPAAPAQVAKADPTPARAISDTEFKSLRTIDEELVIYVIKQGDSLASVAQKYYGSAAKERIIADLNFIENPSSVKVGEEIIVDVRPLTAKKKGSRS